MGQRRCRHAQRATEETRALANSADLEMALGALQLHYYGTELAEGSPANSNGDGTEKTSVMVAR